MSLASDIQAILAADAALIAIFTAARIITYEALGDLGLNRTGFPAAFDTVSSEILPTLVIRDRIANTTYAMRGEDEQIASYVQAVEIVGYLSRLDNDTLLDTALARVYTLLQDRNAGTVRMTERSRNTGQREPLLNYCFLSYSVWDGMGLHKP